MLNPCQKHTWSGVSVILSQSVSHLHIKTQHPSLTSLGNFHDFISCCSLDIFNKLVLMLFVAKRSVVLSTMLAHKVCLCFASLLHKRWKSTLKKQRGSGIYSSYKSLNKALYRIFKMIARKFEKTEEVGSFLNSNNSSRPLPS